MCKLLPRKRWIGHDERLDWIGVLTCSHNLLSTTYKLWYPHVTGRKAPPSHGGVGDIGPCDFAAITDDGGSLGLVPDLDPDDPTAAAGSIPAGSNINISAKQLQSSPEENNKTKSTALRFVSIPALPSITIGIRMCCTPIFNMMAESLRAGGTEWDRLQFAKGAHGEPREHRRTLAATCQLEGDAMAGLRAVMISKTAWGVILPKHRTVTFRNCQFRLLSVFACSIKKKHTDVRLNCPFIAFQWVMGDTSLLDQYNQVTCTDRLGHFLEAWCAYWHDQGRLDSRAARAGLESILVLMQEDITEIETTHATIRRELYVLSTQTHSVDFLELSDRSSAGKH